MTSIAEFESKVRHGYADNGGVRIHYAEMGEGPLVVFLHGYPDFWMSWWRQMDALADRYRVVALDLRGYADSDKPAAQEAYHVTELAGDVRAVIRDLGASQATLVGHDWGGFVAWHVAMSSPDWVERLAILSMPHPWAVDRELALNPKQREASAYTLFFQQPDAHEKLPRERLSFWAEDPDFRPRQVEAMAKSNLAGILNYYRENFPAPPYAERQGDPAPITQPTLVVHGATDPYALSSGHDGLWRYVSGPIRLEILPQAGHFVQHDAAEEVTAILGDWLDRTG